jgi:hypothetical protein
MKHSQFILFLVLLMLPSSGDRSGRDRVVSSRESPGDLGCSLVRGRGDPGPGWRISEDDMSVQEKERVRMVIPERLYVIPVRRLKQVLEMKEKKEAVFRMK